MKEDLTRHEWEKILRMANIEIRETLMRAAIARTTAGVARDLLNNWEAEEVPGKEEPAQP